MTVVWPADRGKDWPGTAFAVSCPVCNAEPGQACKHVPEGQSHVVRITLARTLGFKLIKEPA